MLLKKRITEEKKKQDEANGSFFDETETELVSKPKVREPDFLDPDEVVKVRQRNSHKIADTPLACDRTKVSSRNSYAKDTGWLTHENRLTCTLDQTKLER